MSSAAPPIWSATPCTAPTSTPVRAKALCRTRLSNLMPNPTPDPPSGFQACGSALSAHRFGHSSGNALSDVCFGCFHHHPDHRFSSRGTQQDSSGVTELCLSLLDCGLNRRRGGGGGPVWHLHVD